MKTKIIWGVLLTFAAVILVVGAVNRTIAKSSTGVETSEQAGYQHGQSRDTIEEGAANGQGYGARNRSEDGNAGEAAAVQGNGRRSGGRQLEQAGAGNGQAVRDPQAEIGELENMQGTVESVDTERLVLLVDDTQSLEIANRAWLFAQENGFAADPGDTVAVSGFYDGDHFEPVTVTNLTSGLEVQLREESGRPLWAGQGRGRQSS